MVYLNLNILCLPVAYYDYFECVYIMTCKNVNFNLLSTCQLDTVIDLMYQ